MTAGWRRWGPLALLTAVIVLAYAPVRNAGFIWDDDAHVTINPVIIGPLGLKEIWTSAKANYFPLTMTSFWVQHALWGLNPEPYHAVCVWLHASTAIGLALVLRRLKVPGATLGAAIWALHPVQVESVAWISELKNTQSGLFFVASVWFFVRWRQRQDPPAWTRDYGLALACAVLAILSKTSTVMLPVVLGLVWWWLGGLRPRQVLWLVPFLLVSLSASAWTIWEQKVNSMASGPDWHLGLAERAVLSGRVVWFYLGKLAWPHPLIFIYPRWSLEATSVLAWLPLVALLAVAGGLTARRAGLARPWFLAGGYFVVSLFPVLGFFDVFYFRYSYVADHFQYLASMGPLVLVGVGLARLQACRPAKAWAGRIGLALIPLGILAGWTWKQCGIYRDQRTLWSETVALNPHAWIARVNLGVEELAAGHVEAAVAHYRVALELRPGAPEIQTNLGGALLHLGRAEEAVPLLEAAVRSNPRMAEAHNTLGLALARVGRLAEAEQAYETALRLQEKFPAAAYNLSSILQLTQRSGAAITRLEAALPTAADPATRRTLQRRLADLLIADGRIADGVRHLEFLVRDFPGESGNRNELAGRLFQLGRIAEAAAQYEVLVQQQPGSPEARANLGSAVLQLGRPEDAISHYRAALELRPEHAEARANLALALARSGRTAEATAECERVLRAVPGHPVASGLLAELRAASARP